MIKFNKLYIKLMIKTYFEHAEVLKKSLRKQTSWVAFVMDVQYVFR